MKIEGMDEPMDSDDYAFSDEEEYAKNPDRPYI